MSMNGIDYKKVYTLAKSIHPLASYVQASLEIIETSIQDYG